MKAVIMAGGEGSRLRPLTCDIPKPMARLCGRPVLEYILELLAAHGVKDAAVTLRYLPDRIVEHFPGAEYAGIRLDFVEEDEPLGTAGSVKNACGDSEDEILVISGDAMCDFDLADLLRRHRLTGADVTIAAKRVEDPREYGLIDADEGGTIRGFIEKPAFSQAVSDFANTGIYLLSGRALELIPAGRSFDFAKDLFPLMLGKGMKLMCWEGTGYWCDIGDLDSYIQCQRDILHGRVHCSVNGTRDRWGNLFADRPPHAAVHLEAPVYIGRHVRLEEGAMLAAGTVVDDGSYVGQGARVTGSVLLQDSYVGRRARLTGALVCASATVKGGAMLFECATVGAGAVLGEGAVLNAGVKVWNKKRVPPAAVVTEHVKTAAQAKEFFGDDGITGLVGVELTAEFAARFGCAVGSLDPTARIAVGCSIHPGARVLLSALCAGIRSTGADVIDFGENFQSQFEFSMNFCAAGIGVYIRGDANAGIRLFSEGGLPATRSTERSLEAILSRGEFVRRGYDSMGERVEMSGMATMYKSQLARCAPKGLSGCAVRIKCHNLVLKNTLKEVLYKLGCDVTAGMTLEVSAQGDKVRIYDPELGYIHHHKIFAWCCLHELEKGEDIAIPYDAPRMIDDLAASLGRRALRYYACPADDADAAARTMARTQMWSGDALMQSVIFLSLARKAGSMEALLERMPDFDRTVRTLEVEGNPATLLRGLGGEANQENGRIGEGVLVRDSKGVALVRPLKRGTGIRILAEAVSAEIAGEICDDIEHRIKRYLERDGEEKH